AAHLDGDDGGQGKGQSREQRAGQARRRHPRRPQVTAESRLDIAGAPSRRAPHGGPSAISVARASRGAGGREETPTNDPHWIYDTWALANGTGNAIVKRGGDTWFFLTADYAFGYALERDTEAVVVKSGGKVLGKVRHPFPGTDFSSFLLQAKASK